MTPEKKNTPLINKRTFFTKVFYLIIAAMWLGENVYELVEMWPHWTGRQAFHTVLALLILAATIAGLWYEVHTRPRRLLKDVNHNQIP